MRKEGEMKREEGRVNKQLGRRMGRRDRPDISAKGSKAAKICSLTALTAHDDSLR